MIHDLIRDRRATHPPKGWLELSNALRNTNLPREIIGNRKRWLYMTEPKTIRHQSLSRGRTRQRTQQQSKSQNPITWEENR